MSFDLQLIPETTVIVVTLHATFSVQNDTPAIGHRLNALLQDTPAMHTLIIDFREARRNLSIDNVIAGANLAARGDIPLFSHPQVEHVTFIAESRLMKLAARGMNSDSFGNLSVSVYDDLESALNEVSLVAAH